MVLDSRFSRLKTDPRFRKPRKKSTKIVVDDRFKSLLQRKSQSRTDRYGRVISSDHDNAALGRFYRMDESNDSHRQASPDYARGHALVESSDEEEEEEENVTDAEHTHTARILPQSNESAAESLVEPTHRLAVVNLDWDHITASDIYAIFSSQLSQLKLLPKNALTSVHVYPSAFGTARMAKEDVHGPAPDIFKRNESAGDDQRAMTEPSGEDSMNLEALRAYQLERLRYYYAIVQCDSPETSAALYSTLNGTELERSANLLDLSYVPDDMSFTGDCRDKCTAEPTPTSSSRINFATDVLRHSKVKLTWDDNDRSRELFTRRTLTDKELETVDYSAYIASSDSEDLGPELEQNKFRRLLSGVEPVEPWHHKSIESDDLEITFLPALQDAQSVLAGRIEDSVSSRQQRKEIKMKLRRIGGIQNHDSRSSGHSDGDLVRPSTEASSVLLNSSLKKHRGKRRSKKKADPNNSNSVNRSLFPVDDRFKAIHDDHRFAIDPSHPSFHHTEHYPKH